MQIRSKALTVIIVIVIFGGIMGSSALGWWKTSSARTPARLQASGSVRKTAEEVVGTEAYDPAGIRGSHQFGKISEMFGIPLETLARAFALPADVDPATFKNRDFESIYPEFEGEEEIGNGSIKWFVALYTGLPYELEDEEEDTYLLRPAVDILKSRADLTAEQIAYLDAFTIEIEVEAEAVENSQPEDKPQASQESKAEAENAKSKQVEMAVAGKTTFADLLDWGVPVEQIESIINDELPNRLMLVRDYCTKRGLSWGAIKMELQAEVNKLTP